MTPTLEEALHDASRPAMCVDDLHWTKAFLLDDDFPGFLGHFPGHPVLPAMTQLVMARLLFQEIVGPADALNVVSAKYLHPIRPRQPLVAHLILGKAHNITVEIHVTEGEVARLASSVQFKPIIFG